MWCKISERGASPFDPVKAERVSTQAQQLSGQSTRAREGEKEVGESYQNLWGGVQGSIWQVWRYQDRTGTCDWSQNYSEMQNDGDEVSTPDLKALPAHKRVCIPTNTQTLRHRALWLDNVAFDNAAFVIYRRT